MPTASSFDFINRLKLIKQSKKMKQLPIDLLFTCIVPNNHYLYYFII